MIVTGTEYLEVNKKWYVTQLSVLAEITWRREKSLMTPRF